ncbi:membrane lipoprotein lipid attachment site-containing protein [Aliivibrio sp. S4TY2]|uniref:membrane lipoprotein lipid attachment site-containing protein n=1 Tax=unclassified Aliivibrio TaxID=2645654 RepID=UPI002378EEFF|nr:MULTISPECIES: membrane lipoprotein lipid attachment site-containing protein [unclassified Aliivibrio]MDD9155059.1 membrane lipoprotein lipid attachment site-containing protein [Aliivibrio sp. S4TY2]MDD9158578.1 membrane lipoprotein lipid attachment site-containing protein [Aliivibrio sp. S4TY1]MDD9163062.1 membrane lipoprotein lipid attachment site-containing protein [Aliivibrio sp. S4MY2]MDD9166577.1 membrane lipoprotein lipid attachment site-containing protein [Aliivibrio sp. S4MY4]MDD918
MKKVLLASVMAVALSGCQMTTDQQADWKQDNKIEMMNAQIQLDSAVWIDQMPTIGEETDESKVNFALTLTSEQVIAPELMIDKVILRQGDNSWSLSDDEFEVRVHDNHTWEVAGQSFYNIDATQLIDIAIEANNEWIVETDVQVDTVY